MKFTPVRPGGSLRLARQALADRGLVPDGLLRDTIQRSWSRCATWGLGSGRRSDAERLGSASLSEIQERNLTLVAHARPLMDNLYEQIARTQSMVILTDAEGLILHSLGDQDFVSRAERVSLQPGASWAEAERGTNAIGTAVAERSPVLVHGAEHFLERNGFLTCSASPIFDPRGALSGVLDISGDSRGYQNHSLALVRMSAQMIENRLLLSEFGHELTITFHSRAELLGTICEAIAVVGGDGGFLSANRNAVAMLDVPLEQLRARTFASVFDAHFESLLEPRAAGGGPVELRTRNGLKVFARVHAGSGASRWLAARAVHRHTLDEGEPVARAGTAAAAPEVARARARLVPARDLSTLESLSFGDPRMDAAVEKARRVVGRDIPILIEGESGAGKELFALAFHRSGLRRDGPFIAVNCAAIPEGLIESELFGHTEGAFTGARRRGATGKIQQAHGGTLFLDEIGDMPLSLQSRLLRVLQERAVTPLGATRPIQLDISLVCATHRRLKEEVARGGFRQDLYYRLNGLRFTLPPLRERSDLRELVRFIVEKESDDGRAMVSPEVMALFDQYPWPGNMRQLSNVIRASLALVGEGRMITRDCLPEDLLEDLVDMGIEAAAPGPAPALPAVVPAGVPIDLCGNLEELEARAIRKALDDHGGNVSAAARQLGISRNTLYRKLGRF